MRQNVGQAAGADLHSPTPNKLTPHAQQQKCRGWNSGKPSRAGRITCSTNATCRPVQHHQGLGIITSLGCRWRCSHATAHAGTTQVNGTAVVVGAGVSGLMAALQLARFGMSVQVYEESDVGLAVVAESTAPVILSPAVLKSFQEQGIDVQGHAFGLIAQMTSETRVIDCLTPIAEAAPLESAQVYTSYGRLKQFLVTELERLVPGQITFHANHRLEGVSSVNVAEKVATFASPNGHVAAPYNFLVGADGTHSTVRQALVACDKTMSSMLTFVAPMRYVTGAHLDSQPAWPHGKLARMTQAPLEQLYTDSSVATSARRSRLATPLVFFGQPNPRWGGAKYFKIKLMAFADPGGSDEYHGMLDGSVALFDELAEQLEDGGRQAVHEAMQGMFMSALPETWVAALTDAFIACPQGFSRGGTVMANKLASPEAAPAIALLGDAVHGTSWRLGFSMQAAIDSAVALGAALRGAESLTAALHAYNASRAGPTAALANIDRLAPAFTGEHASLGALRVLVQCALAARVALSSMLATVGLRHLAPHPSYLSALKAGKTFEEVWKRVKTEVAMASAAFLALIIWTGQLGWRAYRQYQYGY